MSSTISSADLSAVHFTSETVLTALHHLKPGKSDGTDLGSDHFIHAAPAIADLLASFFTALARHGYMSDSIRNCILLPIPKGHMDPSVSDNYCAIALAPTLSKVFEWCILLQYSEFFYTSGLQFGFKKNMSTTLCTGLTKNTISRYMHCGSSVCSCFLDASKAFDQVDHVILFKKLIARNLPPVITHLLLSW